MSNNTQHESTIFIYQNAFCGCLHISDTNIRMQSISLKLIELKRNARSIFNTIKSEMYWFVYFCLPHQKLMATCNVLLEYLPVVFAIVYFLSHFYACQCRAWEKIQIRFQINGNLAELWWNNCILASHNCHGDAMSHIFINS